MPKSWKIVQSKKRNATKTKWALIALAVVVGIIALGELVRLTQTIFRPWDKFHWQGDFNINVIVKAKNISLLSYNPHEQKIFLIDIPDQTFLDTSGRGRWELRSIYPLGGNKLLTSTLKSLFALPIDGFLDFSGNYDQKETSEIIGELRKNPFSLLSILPFLKTNLTPWELFKLKMGLTDVRFDKIKQVNLENLGVLQKGKLPDGSEVWEADTVRLDGVLSDLTDPEIAAEHKSVAIFNTTSKPLLAQRAARMVTNLGGNVIITSNSQMDLQITQVVGAKSKTLDRLKQIFGSNVTIDPQSEDLASSRAEINIFLGEDY